MKTNGDILREQAVQAGIPLRTLEQVKNDLTSAKKNKCEASVARLTDEARAYIVREYPQ